MAVDSADDPPVPDESAEDRSGLGDLAEKGGDEAGVEDRSAKEEDELAEEADEVEGPAEGAGLVRRGFLEGVSSSEESEHRSMTTSRRLVPADGPERSEGRAEDSGLALFLDGESAGSFGGIGGIKGGTVMKAEAPQTSARPSSARQTLYPVGSSINRTHHHHKPFQDDSWRRRSDHQEECYRSSTRSRRLCKGGRTWWRGRAWAEW